jgi:ABC-type polysaccharide/polyol phosphate export permease
LLNNLRRYATSATANINSLLFYHKRLSAFHYWLSSRYKGTILGIFWLFLQPLLMVVVYSFVFSVIMKVRIPGMENSYHFALFLMAAMMPYLAFQDAVLAASNSLFAGSSL